jgi:sulfur-carrier protein adenylyltransferase/sulfurtransferase
MDIVFYVPTMTMSSSCSIGNRSQEIPEITCQELKELLDEQADICLIDVREPHEYDFCKIEGATLIPLGQLSDHLASLDKEVDYVMQCRSGGRSGQATMLMLNNGFTKVRNLVGGILQWSDDIDPSITKY